MTTEAEAMTPEVIAAHLKRAIKHGARAEWLWERTPELVDILCPPASYDVLTDLERADRVEGFIREVCATELDGPVGRALLVLLTLAPGTAWTRLEHRYYHMGAVLGRDGIQPDTVRRPYIRNQLINGLAVELYRKCRPTEAA